MNTDYKENKATGKANSESAIALSGLKTAIKDLQTTLPRALKSFHLEQKNGLAVDSRVNFSNLSKQVNQLTKAIESQDKRLNDIKNKLYENKAVNVEAIEMITRCHREVTIQLVHINYEILSHQLNELRDFFEKKK